MQHFMTKVVMIDNDTLRLHFQSDQIGTRLCHVTWTSLLQCCRWHESSRAFSQSSLCMTRPRTSPHSIDSR